jgi:hypothetical protein
MPDAAFGTIIVKAMRNVLKTPIPRYSRLRNRLISGLGGSEEGMELIRTNSQRLSALVEYLHLLYQGPVAKEIFENYRQVLHSAGAHEVNEALDMVLREAADMDPWKVPVARFIRSVSRGLDAESPPEYPAGGLFAELEKENSSIEAELNALQARLLQSRGKSAEQVPIPERKGVIPWSLSKRSGEGWAILAVENPLPAASERTLSPLRKSSSNHGCVSLMWSLQDDVLALQAGLVRKPVVDSGGAASMNYDLARTGTRKSEPAFGTPWAPST